MSKKLFKKKPLIVGITIIVILIVLGGYLTMTSEKSNKVKIETSLGVIVLELNAEASPITVQNFLSYVDEGFYDGTVFHRVINDFMIQGGGFTPNGEQKETFAPITLESDNGLKNEKGTIAMARTNAPNSATSQFFINTNNNVFLNHGGGNDGYAVFGKVIEGIDIVEKIEKVSTGVKNGMGDWPTEEVMIISVKRV